MTTTIDRKTLVEALGRLALTAGDGRSYPVMAAVRFGDGAATTTNMESFTTVPVPGVPPLAVDCRRLLAIVRALDGDGVTLEPHGFDVTVACGRSVVQAARLEPRRLSDPIRRLIKVNDFLRKELEVSAIQAKIQDQAREEIDRTQREYFLGSS